MSAIDTYLEPFPPAVRARLQQVREAIAEEAPGATETLSYGIPTFDLAGTHLVHFAGFARHVGFYPAPSGIAAHQEALAGYKQAKGSVQFPLDRPLPLDVIRAIVRFRVAEVLASAAQKRRAKPG